MTISQHAKEANLDKKAIMYQVYEPSKQIGALIECFTYFVSDDKDQRDIRSSLRAIPGMPCSGWGRWSSTAILRFQRWVIFKRIRAIHPEHRLG